MSFGPGPYSNCGPCFQYYPVYPGIGCQGPTGIKGPTGTSGYTGPTGPKSFVIDHPLNPERYLVHGCIEGPEMGVYYRGESKIEVNHSSSQIILPDYVSTLAYDFTVQITPIYCGKKTNILSTSEVENNIFTVYGKSTQFYWFVYGVKF